MGRNVNFGITSLGPNPNMLSGSTAARPTLAAAQAGAMYYNTDANQVEVWQGNYWHIIYGYPNVTVSTSQTVGSNHTYFVNTSGAAVTLTLPLTPRQGDRIMFYDTAGTFGTNNLTIGNNGHRIQRQLDTMTVSTNGAAFALVYFDVTRGWLLETI